MSFFSILCFLLLALCMLACFFAAWTQDRHLQQWIHTAKQQMMPTGGSECSAAEQRGFSAGL